LAISRKPGKLVWTLCTPKGICPSLRHVGLPPAYGNGVVVGVVSLGDNFLHRSRHTPTKRRPEKFLWSFDVIPGPGRALVHERPGLQDSDIWKYGGGAIWTTPSVEILKLGLVCTSPPENAGTAMWWRVREPGNNLYNNSVVQRSELKHGKNALVFPGPSITTCGSNDLMHTAGACTMPRLAGGHGKAIAAMRTDGILFILDPSRRQASRFRLKNALVKQDAFLKTSPTQRRSPSGRSRRPRGVEKDMIPPDSRRLLFRSHFHGSSKPIPPHMNIAPKHRWRTAHKPIICTPSRALTPHG
jgi:hypothetical protein